MQVVTAWAAGGTMNKDTPGWRQAVPQNGTPLGSHAETEAGQEAARGAAGAWAQTTGRESWLPHFLTASPGTSVRDRVTLDKVLALQPN